MVRRKADATVLRHQRQLRALTLAGVLTMFGTTAGVAAQEIEVPVAVQVPLFLKVMTFDRQRRQVPDAETVVGITFQSGYRASISVRDEAARALNKEPQTKVRVVLIDLDRGDLAASLLQHRVQVLYVSPLRALNVSTVAGIAAAAHVTTVTGVPHYVEQGVAVGLRLQSERPRLMVNLAASRLCGADFTAELLKLAEVIP